jgi:3-hydroxyisobutyrate dehydrogenase-like beta-hydroxyacid dehydrogenase
MRIAVIGLGAMGAPIAQRLVDAGHELTVYNRTAEKARALVERGVRVAASPAQAASAAEIAITMLADDETTEELVLAPDGLAAGLPSGAVHMAMGTLSIALAERLTALHAERGQVHVAATVLGRPPAAAAGELYVMAAGPAAVLTRIRPVLDAIGQRVFIIGEQPQQANLLKLCTNFLIYSTIEQLGEVFALAGKGGINRAAVLEVLTNSFFSAPVHKNYGKLIVEGRFDPPGAKVTIGEKDTRLMLRAGEELAVPLPFASIVYNRFLAAIAQGERDLDFTVLGRYAEREAGLKG